MTEATALYQPAWCEGALEVLKADTGTFACFLNWDHSLTRKIDVMLLSDCQLWKK